ncbi:MAG: M24 family metallopeptidase [Dehalococcoidia bacterium]
MAELETKLALVREAMARHGLTAVRLRGVDWFAWATCGGSSVVILTAEAGVAEALITRDDAWAVTDAIEAARLREEELPLGFDLWAAPWNDPAARDEFVRGRAGTIVASDRPAPGERPLPPELVVAKRRLLPQEVARYRVLGADAARAVSEALRRARPDETERELAGAAARALWARGIHPTLTLVAGERRLPRYRHPTAGADRLGGRAMLVVCGRRHGLYANLTRFVYFRPPTNEERRLTADVTAVEAAAWAASRPGAPLGAVYDAIVRAYAERGHPGAEEGHHQGGTTGYLSREVVALPGDPTVIEDGTALAWNPSLPGAKIEDTVLTTEQGIEILTDDPAWPSVTVAGRRRPDLLVRSDA